MEKCDVTPVPQMVEETVHVRKSVPQSDVVRDKSGEGGGEGWRVAPRSA